MSKRSRPGSLSRHSSHLTNDEDSDEYVEMTSPLSSSPTDEFSEDSKTSQNDSSGDISKPLTMRISGSQGRSLFPTSTVSLRPKANSEMADATRKDSFSFSKDEGGIQKKRRYKYESMAQMIEWHVEELKKRPPLGEANEHKEKHGEDGGEPRSV
ncbi:hypothetical protein K449DRAFT_427170 [Hypoxylon sp. EC38]|nr:hypothetical protein K449DRAFT_427170 [Hypoxylon sp. EC38]